jgi:phage recombination protein Bet
MSELAAVQDHGALVHWNDQQVEVLRGLIAPGVSDSEFVLFGQVCQRTGLDPFARQIYAITRNVYNRETKRKEPKMTIQVSIDGLRLIADRSGQYAGSETLWCGPDGKWVDVWLKPGPPAAAKTTVWKNGSDRTFIGVARFGAYCQSYDGKPQGLWDSMPDVMIGKCSEALALRKAFPADMSGLYTREEMQQAETVDVAIVDSARALAPSVISEAQKKRLFAIAKKNAWPKEDVKEMILNVAGVDSSAKIPKVKYDDVVAAMESIDYNIPITEPDQVVDTEVV